MLEIGNSLREARKHRQLELADVEAATRIRSQQLAALEREQFDALPPDPYRRSFLREYAEFLGLDGDIYVSEYDLRFRAPESAPPPPPPRRQAELGLLLGPRPLLLAAGAVAVAAIIGASVWAFGGSGRPASPTVAAPASTSPPPTKQQSPPPATTPSGPQSLVLTSVRGSCWLWVRLGANGATVYEQTLQPGQTVRFGLRKRLWIRIGAPWNIEASIGRRSLSSALPARTGDVFVTAAGVSVSRA